VIDILTPDIFYFLLFAQKVRKYVFKDTTLYPGQIRISPSRPVPRDDTTKPRLQGSMLWSQFSAIFDNFRKKIGVTNVMIKIFHNLALFCVKNANFFAEFFGENIKKI
jgi:hypothetical protein